MRASGLSVDALPVDVIQLDGVFEALEVGFLRLGSTHRWAVVAAKFVDHASHQDLAGVGVIADSSGQLHRDTKQISAAFNRLASVETHTDVKRHLRFAAVKFSKALLDRRRTAPARGPRTRGRGAPQVRPEP